MGIYIQWDIKGQRVNQIKLDEQKQQLIIQCRRDKRIKAIDQITRQKGTINRQARDVPLLGYPCLCVIEVESAQVCISNSARRLEQCEFVDKRSRITRRFCRMISSLCRSIQASGGTLGDGEEYVSQRQPDANGNRLYAQPVESAGGLLRGCSTEHQQCTGGKIPSGPSLWDAVTHSSR